MPVWYGEKILFLLALNCLVFAPLLPCHSCGNRECPAGRVLQFVDGIYYTEYVVEKLTNNFIWNNFCENWVLDDEEEDCRVMISMVFCWDWAGHVMFTFPCLLFETWALVFYIWQKRESAIISLMWWSMSWYAKKISCNLQQLSFYRVRYTFTLSSSVMTSY